MSEQTTSHLPHITTASGNTGQSDSTDLQGRLNLTSGEMRARLMQSFPDIEVEGDTITNPEILFKRALGGDPNSIQPNLSSLTPG